MDRIARSQRQSVRVHACPPSWGISFGLCFAAACCSQMLPLERWRMAGVLLCAVALRPAQRQTHTAIAGRLVFRPCWLSLLAEFRFAPELGPICRKSWLLSGGTNLSVSHLGSWVLEADRESLSGWSHHVSWTRTRRRRSRASPSARRKVACPPTVPSPARAAWGPA